MNMADASKAGIPSRYILLTVNILFLLLMLIYRMGPTIADVDIWHQMALVRKSIEIGYIPYHDLFSYAKTIYPSVHHELGAGAIAYLVTRILGGNGIVLLRYLLVAGLSFILFCALKRKRSHPYIVLFLLPLPIFLFAYGTSAVRAHMYSFLFTAVLLWFLDIDDEGKRWWIFAWLLIFIAWVNIHGGFLVGIGLTLIHGLDRCIRKKPCSHIAAVIAAMAICVALTPYGVHYYPYIFHAVTMDRPHISEWHSVLAGGSVAQTGFSVLALSLTLYAVAREKCNKTAGIYLLLATALVSIKANRFWPFFSILWIYMMPKWIEHTPLGEKIIALYEKRAHLLLAVFAVSATLFAVKIARIAPWNLQIPNSGRPEWGNHPIYPVGAVDYLSSRGVTGNILVPFDYGAFVLWKLHPNMKVSLDSRYEVAYSAEVVDDQFKLYMGVENWKELLRKYNPDIILTHTALPLSEKVRHLADWSLVYSDANWELFSKDAIRLPRMAGPNEYYSGTIFHLQGKGDAREPVSPEPRRQSRSPGGAAPLPDETGSLGVTRNAHHEGQGSGGRPPPPHPQLFSRLGPPGDPRAPHSEFHPVTRSSVSTPCRFDRSAG